MNRIDYSIARVDSVLPADWRRPVTADRQDKFFRPTPQEKLGRSVELEWSA